MVAIHSTAYQLPAAEVVAQLASDANQGLSDQEAAARLARYGTNELAQAPPDPAWRRLLAQFTELVIGILIAAALISGFLGEWIDALAILAIVIANGLIGFFQEQRAQRALEALKSLSIPVARVIRDGREQRVPAQTLVPGDRIQLEAGDHVPADARLLSAFGVRASEAALTGESKAVRKVAEGVHVAETPLAELRNMVFMGTLLTSGRAAAVVTATGMQTELGAIADLLSRAKTESTPLQRRLTQLGKALVVVCLSIVAVIFVLQLARGGQLIEVAIFSISLAVAAVPEGLPAVVTIALALGLQRMVRRNALVRRLPSVETLGSVTVVCSDKTGTLTQNEMTVRVVVAGDTCYRVSGVGYNPDGEILTAADLDDALDHSTAIAPSGQSLEAAGRDRPALERLLAAAVYCNDAKLSPPRARPRVVDAVGRSYRRSLDRARVERGNGRQISAAQVE